MHTASYIYYPHGALLINGIPGGIPGGKGHAELEIDDTVYSFSHPKQLSTMIDKSTMGCGRPFFRFVFKATTDQIDDMQKIIGHRNGLTCGYRAGTPLHETRICSIPLPLRLSSLLSAAYLTSGKLFGCNNIKTIEFYGGPSKSKNALAIIPGVLGESFLIGMSLWRGYTILKNGDIVRGIVIPTILIHTGVYLADKLDADSHHKDTQKKLTEIRNKWAAQEKEILAKGIAI